jgi:CubicO group peptidase (beta-lactamase class C family)
MPNLHTVLANLDKKLGYTEGHSIAIYDGLDLEFTTGSGNARVNPTVAMTSLIRMDVLSMSKTITAAGVVRQLLAMGLTPQEKIGPHLPSYWTVDPQVSSLAFAHVLTHSGGLVGDQADFNQVQALCASKPAARSARSATRTSTTRCCGCCSPTSTRGRRSVCSARTLPFGRC